MILKSLQPRFAKHLMGFPYKDFGSLVQALYGIEEGIAKGLWPESSLTDFKGKKAFRRTEIRRCWCYQFNRNETSQELSNSQADFQIPLPTITLCDVQATCSLQTHDSYLTTSSLTACFCCTCHRETSCLELYRPLLMCKGHHVSFLSWVCL